MGVTFDTEFILVEHGTNLDNWELHTLQLWEIENLVRDGSSKKPMTYDEAKEIDYHTSYWRAVLDGAFYWLECCWGTYTILGSDKQEAIDSLNNSINDLDLDDEWDKQRLVMLEKQKRAVWELPDPAPSVD